ncbi:MAG: Ppx/GppA family phosphatase [Bacteroidota bacterium]|nr:Ppx/GppA family phosphatase [Bacteroidota bacterium]
MRFSVIDIGTNTILLLVADIDRTGIRSVVYDEQVIARLGKGVDEHKMINRETFRRVLQFLQAYRATSETLRAEKIVAVGTSALRDAANRNEFCDFIEKETGISIEILSGDEEAEYTFRGAISGFLRRSASFSVLDIGGGSTEIISETPSQLTSKTSLDIGSVRITERFLKTSPPTALEVSEARSCIQRALANIDLSEIRDSKLIGVAGTLTTLAALQQKLPEYNPHRVEGFELSYSEIRILFNQLRIKTVEEIRAVPQISAGRADIILAGILILLEFMEAANAKQITVSDRGLRYGIALRESKT